VALDTKDSFGEVAHFHSAAEPLLTAAATHIAGNRPDRFEPRLGKRRSKDYRISSATLFIDRQESNVAREQPGANSSRRKIAKSRTLRELSVLLR
jgi:hypothetical protein